jgi:hypothetical protein
MVISNEATLFDIKCDRLCLLTNYVTLYLGVSCCQGEGLDTMSCAQCGPTRV